MEKTSLQPTMKLELIGDRYGFLTVDRLSHVDKRYMKHWHCRCDCGNLITVRTDNLKGGKTTSCGCGRYRQTIGQVNQRSNRPHASPTIHIHVHTTGPARYDGRRKGRAIYLQIFMDGEPGYLLTPMGVFAEIQGPTPAIMKFALAVLYRRKEIGPQGSQSYETWRDVSGVEFEVKTQTDHNALGKRFDAHVREAYAAGYDLSELKPHHYPAGLTPDE